MLAEGEVDEKQAKFLLKELDCKISAMKTSSLKIKVLTSLELLSGAKDLISIFGEEFVQQLTSQHHLVETKFGQYENIASVGEASKSIYIVTRGNFEESAHTAKMDREQEGELPKLQCKEGSLCRLQELIMPGLSNVYTGKT